MSESPKSEETIFGRAVELPAADRNAYLDQACGEDTTLRARVEALLRAHDEAGNLLDVAPGGAVRAALSSPLPEEKPGTLIGRYKLLQKIGEGGCGIVFMAEQAEPIRRRVALKVIKLGMDTREVITRFEAERQALARMDHPNIARVLDAGATAAGRPFFVMELVRGVKITDYCDQHNLPTAERLKIFSQICHAIEHAHAKGIVHRDIKPSNILVTVIDGVAVPKVIDFGIAKATQGWLTDRTLFTAFEQFIGTPAYMSPEQTEMSGVEIDTRSDIYSLGVLLYELLTGRPPFDPQELLRAGLDAMRRCIREVEPPRPSTRLSTLEADALNLTALHRDIAASRLIHSVRGDLDWIAMRCLEKDRHRRYQSAAALADDLQRHLEHRPVAAHRPGLFYRTGKFIRRHRNNLAIASVALLCGAGGGLWLYRQSISALSPAAPAARREATAVVAADKIGVLGESAAITFSGNHAFSSRAIREGLAADNTFILAAHPEAPLEELIGVIQRAVSRGYRGLGFPEATVAVRTNASRQRLEVAIVEGPRFYRGHVTVHGADRVPVADIVRALTAPARNPDALAGAVTTFLAQQPKEDQMMDALQALLKPPASGQPDAPSGPTPAKPVRPDLFSPPAHPVDARWVEGTPASFAEDEVGNIVATTRQLFDEKGFPLAEVQAQLHPDPVTGRAGLQLQVQEGPAVTIGVIKVSGNNRNTAEEIIRCTGLATGMKLDAAVIARAKVALWSSARFYAFGLSVRPPTSAGDTCAVAIAVDESEVMPPLREALPRYQAALVQFANWMTTESARRELDFSVSGPGLPDFSVALTPENFSAIYTEGSGAGSLLALLVRPDGFRLFAAGNAGSSGLDLSRANIRPTAFIHLTTSSLARDPVHHANANFGLGWTSGTGDDSSRLSPIVISPTIVCQYLVPKAVPSFEHGEVALSDTAGGMAVQLRFREETGELIEFNAVPMFGDGAAHDNSMPRVTLRIGNSNFARIARRVDQEWAQLPYDPAQRRSLADLLLGSDLRKQFADTPAARPMLLRTATAIRLGERLFATQEMRAWLDYAPSPDDPAFPIPTDPQNPGPANDVIRSGAQLLYQFGRIFNPAQSWPTRLVRELPYLLEAQAARSAAVFDDLANDKDMGPVGSLLAARLLAAFGSPQAWRFARRTAEHSSLEEFRQDYHTLFEGDSTMARLVRGVLPAIASLRTEELDELAADFSADEAQMWRQCVATLRDVKAEGVAAALRPQLETWWERQMRPRLADRISGFVSGADPVDPTLVAATVNGRAISRNLLKAVRRNPSLLTPVPPEAPLAAAAGQTNFDPALEALVTLTLVLDDATHRGVDTSDATMERKVEKIIREQYGGDQRAFETMLGRDGMMPEDFRELTRLNDAYAEMGQTIGPPAVAGSPTSPGAPAELSQGLREPNVRLNEEQRHRAIADRVKCLRDTAFIHVIPEPVAAPTR